MAELVIGPLISNVKEKASSYLLDQYRVIEGMEEQRKILERKLPAILDIIQDAEEKGASRPGVRAWLKDLKTVSYEANDIFDEFNYEALRREAQKKGHHRIKALTSFPARNPIAFRYRMGKKLRKIVQTVEVLVTEMNTFGFRHLQQAPPSKQWRNTDPVMVDSDKDIINKSRDEEKKKIMSILLHEASSKDLTVLPIVGMGGLGKTTFVQLIYNDPAIEKHFELKRWCCVSNDFDAANIASNICQTNVNDSKGREKALQDLQSLISGKRYLIVLDDIRDPDEDKWGKLKTCLKHGGKGSAVLTTTRKPEIARKMSMGAAQAHNIEKLSDKYVKEIIQIRAFSLQKPNHHELDEIVDKIVDRCGGSPLAAKAFGSILSTKTSTTEWNDILAKSICTERTGILPILKLSFDDLPSHMKQCFAFCALFPKDYEISKELLIQLWMAHDFIPVQEGDHPEAVGEEIFKELTWRSFFQDVEERRYYSQRLRNVTTCKIHDDMHDIAQFVMGKECATIVDELNMKKLPDPTALHFFSPIYPGRALMDDFLKKQSSTLRTLLCGYFESPHNISKYTLLRALHIHTWLPRQIHLRGQMHHLRYIDMSNSIDLKLLPEGISIMYHLQTLNISHCQNLCHLPKDMKYMASLRHLYTHGCSSLTSMPPGLGQITSLQTLTYFVAGANFSCSTIEELRHLNLGGELELCCLENATEVHAKEVGLEKKEKLTHLSLEWTRKGQKELVQDCHKKVLYGLKPYKGLKMLRLVNYQGNSLPTWIVDLSNLTELHLFRCALCEEFPQFCDFKVLRVLYLEELNKLRSLCRDMASITFQALRTLRLRGLESLERWVATEGKEDVMFHVLKELDIMHCSKLTTLPEAPSLKRLNLVEGKALLSLELVIKSRSYMTSLSVLYLVIFDKEEPTSPQIDQNHESSLSELKLQGCNFFFSNNPSQATFGAWKWFGELVSLSISNCDALLYWPEDVFQSLVLLKNLRIEDCNKLTGCTPVRDGESTQRADPVLPHLNMIHIYSCESLEELFILPPSLKTLNISGCPRLDEFIREKEGPLLSQTNRHPCLEMLHIRDLDNLATLLNLPPSLKAMSIDRCGKLCSLSGHLDALETLSIHQCSKLQSLDSLGNLDALRSLFIGDCSKLQSLDSLGNLPSLERLTLVGCRCLASLPGVLGNYSALRNLEVKYCQAIDLKPLYKHHQQLLDSLVAKDISHAHSSNPYEGPKLKAPRSWKYAIPGVSEWTQKRHDMQYF